MKKITFFTIISFILLIFSCSTTGSLVLTEEGDRDFHLINLQFKVAKDIDINQNGKEFITTHMPDIINALYEEVGAEHDLYLNFEDYIYTTEHASTEFKVTSDEVSNIYTWANPHEYYQAFTLIISYGDGSLSLACELVQNTIPEPGIMNISSIFPLSDNKLQ